MSTQAQNVSATDTAALLHKNLKATHPRASLTVTSHRYTGDTSIDVNWTDGPTETEVEQTTELYRGATFGGTTGPRQSHDTLLSTKDDIELVHFAPHYTSRHRKLPPDFRTEMKAEIAKTTNKPFGVNKPPTESQRSTPRTPTHPQLSTTRTEAHQPPVPTSSPNSPRTAPYPT